MNRKFSDYLHQTAIIFLALAFVSVAGTATLLMAQEASQSGEMPVVEILEKDPPNESTQSQAAEPSMAPSTQKTTAGTPQEDARGNTPRDATFWFRKGALVATYGNNKAAVDYFQRALRLNPQLSRAYFAQGVSFGQLGDFDRALTLISKAISMEPENGMYFYGRGRVYLLAGDKQKAMSDLKKASELDDADAIAYLDYLQQLK